MVTQECILGRVNVSWNGQESRDANSLVTPHGSEITSRTSISAFFLFVVAIMGVLLAIGCAQTPKATLGESLQLFVGEKMQVENTDLEIEFKGVLEDSRCPQGEACAWEGKASVLANIIHDGSADNVVLIQPGGADGNSTERFKEYLIQFKLTPYPDSSGKPSSSEYRLSLTVTK
jgi:hypothetical protein